MQRKNPGFNMEWERKSERIEMVQAQIRSRGIVHKSITHAMEIVPRHFFVPSDWSREAYGDFPIPIGYSQTISQPYIVARMTELLDLHQGDTVLEVGTGSGYQAAILVTMGARVFSLERIPEVAEIARNNLHRAGITGVRVYLCDGTEGWPEDAPYDRILITAASPSVPAPLLQQLGSDGILVAPVGTVHHQVLVKMSRQGDEFTEEKFEDVRFVPLIGRYGWGEMSPS